MSRNGTRFRILAPDFLTFMSNYKTDLKHPLTIFDKTAKDKKARRPRRTQEDSGALWLASRRLRAGNRNEGQGPTTLKEVPKQARSWQGSPSGGEDTNGCPKGTFPHSSALLFDTKCQPETRP